MALYSEYLSKTFLELPLIENHKKQRQFTIALHSCSKISHLSRNRTNLESGGRALVVGHLSASDFMKGTLREGSFTGDPERYVKQGSELGVCFHWGPAFAVDGGALLS